jgi:hypothetical protein
MDDINDDINNGTGSIHREKGTFSPSSNSHTVSLTLNGDSGQVGQVDFLGITTCVQRRANKSEAYKGEKWVTGGQSAWKMTEG